MTAAPLTDRFAPIGVSQPGTVSKSPVIIWRQPGYARPQSLAGVLPTETHPVQLEDRSVLVNGEHIAYSMAGEGGIPVVMAHGGASDRGDWNPVVQPLADQRRVYMPDFIGYGDSARPRRVYTLRLLSDFILDFMRTLGIERAHLVGHSLGGLACLDAAHRAPEVVDRLVLVAPVGFGRLSPTGLILQHLIRISLILRGKALPYPRLRVHMVDTDLDRFLNVKAPCLVLWGARDLYLPMRHADRVLEVVPNARLEVFHDCGHAPHMEASGRFAATVSSFLTEDGLPDDGP